MSVERSPEGGDRLIMAAERARAAWRRLWLRLQGVTPSGAARIGLVILAIALIAWIAITSWPALLPFAIGGGVAYVVLPIVNGLNRFMPRLFAVLLTMAGVVLSVALIIWLIIPPVVDEVSRAILALPGLITFIVDREQLAATLRDLPAPVQEAVQRGLDNLVAGLDTGINQYLDNPLRSLAGLTNWLAESLGFLLGFLVIPTWLLLVLRNQPAASQSLGRLVPGWLAPDFWAVVRITDRAMGTFVRGQLALGLAVGIASWGGLTLLDAFYGQPGINAGEYSIAAAALVAIFSLIPVVGPILGLIAVALLGWTFSGEVAILAPLVVLAAQQLIRQTLEPQLSRRVSDLHPTLLVMAIAALSQFGIVWVFLAAPVAVVARDLYRYTYRRVGDPALTADVALRQLGIIPATRPIARRRLSLVNRRYRARQAR